MSKHEANGVLSRDSILACDDAKLERVEMPEWGGAVCVRTLTGAERDVFEKRAMSDGKVAVDQLRAVLVVMTAADAKGAALFTMADIVAVNGKSAAALDRIFTVALRLNGMSAAEVEELAKN